MCPCRHIYRGRETGKGRGGGKSHKIIKKRANKQKASCPEPSEMSKLIVKEVRKRLLAFLLLTVRLIFPL